MPPSPESPAGPRPPAPWIGEWWPRVRTWVLAAIGIAFAALVLAALGFGFDPSPYEAILMAIVAVLTLLSVAFYVVEWVRHMGTIEQS